MDFSFCISEKSALFLLKLGLKIRSNRIVGYGDERDCDTIFKGGENAKLP
jgi:hypothetical protein